MGTINHNAIIAATWSDEHFRDVIQWGEKHLPPTSVIVSESLTNGYKTLVMVPDGSKEGWAESDIGDSNRAALIERLTQDEHEDGSSPWNWIEVGFGEYGQKVLRGNCENCYSDAEYQGHV